MKSKDKKALHDKTVDELHQMLKEAKVALFDFNLDRQQNKLKNTKAVFQKRKEIAQLLTVMKEKELAHE